MPLKKCDYWLSSFIFLICSIAYFLITYFLISKTLKSSLLETGAVTLFEIYFIFRLFLSLSNMSIIEKGVLISLRSLFVCFSALLIGNIHYSTGTTIAISGLFIVGVWWLNAFYGLYLPRTYEKYLDDSNVKIEKKLQFFLIFLIFISRITFVIVVLGVGYLLFNKLSFMLAIIISSIFFCGYILLNYLEKYMEHIPPNNPKPSTELKTQKEEKPQRTQKKTK